MACAIMGLGLIVLCDRPLCAAAYYVDFDGGSDDSAGTSPEAAFKHCPGDPSAAGKAKAVQLATGDMVVFRGGVAYFGTVNITASGAQGKPIVFDGGTKGDFGKGPAVIDGGELVTGWKRCASADEAKGNPKWREIFTAEVPTPRGWNVLNLCDGDKPLPMAQSPNPADPFFQEKVAEFFLTESKLGTDLPAKIYPEKGTRVNSERPLELMINKTSGSAVVDPVPGAAVTVELPKPVTAMAFGAAPQPGYPPIKDVAFLADGKEVARASLKKDVKEIQRVELAKPVTFCKLTLKVLSMHEGVTRKWTAIRRLAAFDAKGTDLLEFDMRSTITDPNRLTQSDPHYYDGMMVGFHAGNNIVIYGKALQYDPQAHRLYIEPYSGGLYKQTRYSLYNSVRLIDRPGEYCIVPTDNPKVSRAYLLPERLAGDKPVNITYSRRSGGFVLNGASHIVVQGFRVRRQGGSRATGISVSGGKDVVVRDCEVSLVRGGTAVSGSRVDQLLVERCHVHHNPGHTKGIVFHTCTNCTVQHCKLVKNTSTGLDYYRCTNGKILHNEVTEHYGMHANALTLYLGCKDCEVAYNKVFRSNIGLTIQEAENVDVHHNLLDADNRTMCVGIWVATPFKDIRFLNNTLVRSSPNHPWQAAVFSNNRGPEGLVFKNNIIDGLAGKLPAEYSHNLYTQWGPNQREKKQLQAGELYEPDLKKIFVDPDNGDWRLRPGSPAIDAGADVGLKEDIDGTKIPQGKAPDIGAYERAP
ncbi:MAG TPA: right-handed parallel beta-helix repeat-containing protein [Phycisphaerae bacterium]|nr:right-handed parallel beta-helix repeat-containing protein [Phycisphaerae bacterium]